MINTITGTHAVHAAHMPNMAALQSSFGVPACGATNVRTRKGFDAASQGTRVWRPLTS